MLVFGFCLGEFVVFGEQIQVDIDDGFVVELVVVFLDFGQCFVGVQIWLIRLIGSY